GIIAAAKALQDELLGPPAMPAETGGPLAEEVRAVESFKKAALMVLGLAMQTYRDKLAEQQEVLMSLADILIDAYAAESALLRATPKAGAWRAARQADAARVLVNAGAAGIEASARRALAAMLEGDMLRTSVSALRRLFRQMPVNTVVLRRRLADEAVARRG